MKVIAKPSATSIVGWLREGEALTVLGVNYSPAGGTFLIWPVEQESVALFPDEDFDIIDERLSQRWVIGSPNSGNLFLEPKKWQENDFLDKYHSGNTIAEQVFRNEMARILSE